MVAKGIPLTSFSSRGQYYNIGISDVFEVLAGMSYSGLLSDLSLAIPLRPITFYISYMSLACIPWGKRSI